MIRVGCARSKSKVEVFLDAPPQSLRSGALGIRRERRGRGGSAGVPPVSSHGQDPDGSGQIGHARSGGMGISSLRSGQALPASFGASSWPSIDVSWPAAGAGRSRHSGRDARATASRERASSNAPRSGRGRVSRSHGESEHRGQRESHSVRRSCTVAGG
jgi:hypothetical protein